jgi:uncharacterized RDD family membrane protein YckC
MTTTATHRGGHVEGRQGNYAGAVSRLLAFAVDVGASWGLFTLGAGAVSLAAQLVNGHGLTLSRHQVVGAIVLALWGYIYFAYQWALGGRTLGMAVLGLRVVQAEGTPITDRQAMLRTLVLPVSIALAGMGLVGILVQRERRGLHDLVAGTAVVYAWDARAARLRWLAHRGPGRGAQR